MPGTVLRRVVERPLAVVRDAELQAYPGVVGLRVGHRNEELGQRAPGAAARRGEPGAGAVEDDPEWQGGDCRVEVGHPGRVVALLVAHHRLAQPGPESQREVEVAPVRPVVDVEQVALAQPVSERGRVGKGVRRRSVDVDVEGVDERAQQIRLRLRRPRRALARAGRRDGSHLLRRIVAATSFDTTIA